MTIPWLRVFDRLTTVTDDPRIEYWAGPHSQDVADELSSNGHLVWLDGAGWRHDPAVCPHCRAHHLRSLHKRLLSALQEARSRKDRAGHPWD